MRIFIPLLCYNHTANTEWMMSIFKLFLFFRENNIQASIMPITFDSLVSRARNAAVAHFLSDPAATHILFIDSDIQFEPEHVMRLLHVNQPVVAAGYPQKWFSEEKLKALYSMPQPPTNALELCTYIPVHMMDKNAPPAPVVEAEYVTTGFLLIRRDAFDQMQKKYPERKYTNDIDGYASANPDCFWDFFPVMIHPQTKRLESEDFGFSRLWREAGGKINIVTDVSLIHHGWYGFKGNLRRQMDLMEQMRKAQEAQK